MNELFPRVLPDLDDGQCYFTVAIGKGPVWTNAPLTRNAIIQNGKQYVSKGRDAYFALASYKDPQAGRRQVNAAMLKSFWADIDVGKERSKYKTQQEALAGLGKFVQSTTLTPTFIVSSGKGLHVYWTLTKAIPADLWTQVAHYFKALCNQEGLDIDPARATDCASILRIPDTVHTKSGNPVQILASQENDWEPAVFGQTIVDHLKTLPTITTQAENRITKSQQQAMADAGFPVDPPTARVNNVILGCKQIQYMGFAKYPIWIRAMSVLRSCIDGREWAHNLSSLDKDRYDAEVTDRYFDTLLDSTPCLCEKFELIDPDGCKDCPSRGRVKSPIVLASLPAPDKPEQPKPAPESLDLTNRQQFNRKVIKDKGYTVDKRGIVRVTYELKEDGSYAKKETVLCESQLYYKHGIYEFVDRKPRRSHIFEVVYPTGQSTSVRFDVDEDMTEQGIRRWFNNAKLYSVGEAFSSKTLMNFMNAYLRSVAFNTPDLPTFNTFGWQTYLDPVAKEERIGFVNGAGVVTESGLHPVGFGPGAEGIATSSLDSKGTLEEWKHVPKMYSTLGQKVGELAVCMAFAAPLMKYAASGADSAVLSLWSADSGKGKSHVIGAAASVWGHPMKQFMQRTSSAVLRQRKLAVLNNLPAFMDEMTDVPDEELYGLVYTLLGGKEKEKLKSSGAEFIQTGTWSTVTFTTSNKAIKAAIARQGGDSDATLLRVMEYDCSEFEDYSDRPEVFAYIQACMAASENNYGLAGPEFIYQLLKRSDRLALLPQHINNWVSKNHFTNNERFMSNALAIALKAGRWAKEFGLVEFDMDALEEWVLKVFVPHNRQQTKEWSPDFRDNLLNYLQERLAATLIVKDEHRKAEDKDPGIRGMPDSYILSMPQRDVLVRVAVEDRSITFSCADFGKWCKQKNISPQVMVSKLARDGVILVKKQRSLTQCISWLPTGRIQCFVLANVGADVLGYFKPAEDMEYSSQCVGKSKHELVNDYADEVPF